MFLSLFHFPAPPNQLSFHSRVVYKLRFLNLTRSRVGRITPRFVVIKSGAELVKFSIFVTRPIRADFGADSDCHLLFANVAEESD